MDIEKGLMDTYLKNREMAYGYLKQANEVGARHPFTVIDLRGRAIGLMEANQNLAECLMANGFSIDVYMQTNLD